MQRLFLRAPVLGGVLALCALRSAGADSASAAAPLDTVTVTATALPGERIDIDKIPGNVQVLSAVDLRNGGPASLTGALNASLSSISINDDLDDPFQPDILYRGFDASPVLGTPQGLAVYQNGVRINEAFGDTVNWDLFPDAAISQVELVSASPVYGLNALGGAISVTMKNGFSYQGVDLEPSAGSYGQRSLGAQFGINAGAFGLYVAGRALDWDGWREFSGDRLRDLYAVFSVRIDRATLDLSYTRADNLMHGQGAAPVQELAVERSLAFTGPQANLNSLDFVTLNGTAQLSHAWSLQAVLYYRNYAQTVANGNTTNYEACTSTPGILCQPDGVTPLHNAAGETLPDISDGGTLPIGENDFELLHAWGRGATLQVADSQSLLGHDNQFTLGATLDQAATSFYSGAQIGLINPQLLILPSSLIVDTPESAPGAMPLGQAVPVSVDSVNRNLGAYLTDTVDVSPDLAVTASGRYNIAHIDLADQLGTNLDGLNRYVHFNPALGATYKALATMTLYGGLSQNTRTPTASEIECSNPLAPCLLPTNLAGDPPNLRQVISHTAELGLRGRDSAPAGAARELSWNVGVFRTRLHDDIYGVATSISQGFFQNIGDTERRGVEAGMQWRVADWSGYLNYSLVQATFGSALRVPSPSNPLRDARGDIQVSPGDRMPGIPEHRLKLGAQYRVATRWSVGASANLVSSVFYAGDESNQLAPLPGYAVVSVHATYQWAAHLELFGSISNLFNTRYATWGILGDPTGVGAPGIAAAAGSNGAAVDHRFLSPAAPLEAFAGLRIRF